jgi:serine phosphatase RsbU (regulator of sigma subunit)
VSGDFYWFAEKNGHRIIAAADCTGHGVPGALMSMLGNNFLNQLVNVNGITSPSAILSQLDDEVRRALKQAHDEMSEMSDAHAQDGMDIALLSFEGETKVEYAGAQRPLWLIRNGKVEEIKADKFSIGGEAAGTRDFKAHRLELQKGDCLYISSDGFADQFSRENKKLMTKNFKEKLLGIYPLPMPQQEKLLDEFIEKWKGSLEQTDDILVIGIRI